MKVKSFEEEPNLSLSAYDLLHYDANQATPAITLSSVSMEPRLGRPEPDLLADSATDPHFVVEIEFDGTARLRFGDDVNGLRPESDSVFTAAYRVGNGTAGNVGADTLIHSAGDPRIDSLHQPTAGLWRNRPRNRRPDSPPRPAGVPDSGARRHHGRL